MQSIGERLEEARKRKGISLREAAEATKIRSDFLGYIEANKFDFDLPEIYKKGFIGNYARYLKLDPEKVLTDYHAQQLSSSRLGKKAGSEWFGKMEIKSAAQEQAEVEEGVESASYGRISAKPAATEAPAETEAAPEDESDKMFYLKAGLVFVGTLALVFILFGLVKAILGGSEPDQPELRETSSPNLTASTDVSAPVPPTPPAIIESDSLTLEATGTVYLMVRQTNDEKELYRGTLGEGESTTLTKQGPVDIFFTAGENLVIDHAGERMKPNITGAAKTRID
ncbi:MAG: helix-turn-helix domain-containing protein [Coraliomargarita sp.]